MFFCVRFLFQQNNLRLRIIHFWHGSAYGDTNIGRVAHKWKAKRVKPIDVWGRLDGNFEEVTIYAKEVESSGGGVGDGEGKGASLSDAMAYDGTGEVVEIDLGAIVKTCEGEFLALLAESE